MELPDTSALAIIEDTAGKSWEGRAMHQTQKSDISPFTPGDKTKRK
jgi:hypothetical protein